MFGSNRWLLSELQLTSLETLGSFSRFLVSRRELVDVDKPTGDLSCSDFLPDNCDGTRSKYFFSWVVSRRVLIYIDDERKYI